MSKKDKYASITAGLGDALDKIESPQGEARPRTAPGQLMAFRNEMVAYEEKIAVLEAKVKDLETEAIPIAAISPNPWQPRRVFDEQELNKLAASIAEVGLIQPVIVRSVSNVGTSGASSKSVRTSDTSASSLESVRTSDTRYQLIAGERRWRAHQVIGKTEIKAVVIEVSDDGMAALALAENVDREDLTDYEIALAIRNAESAFPNRKSLASCLGMNRTELYQYLTFFKLPGFVTDALEVQPGLLGRSAAEDVTKVITKRGQAAEDSLARLWPRIKSGEIEQGKIAALIEASLTRSEHVRTERDIRKLFVGKEQAGSITRDANNLTVKIKSAALTPENEAELRRFVEGMFKSGG